MNADTRNGISNLQPVDITVIVQGKPFPQYTSSMILLQGKINNKKILFDAGSPYERDSIKQKFSEKSISPRDIDYLILSHWHMDHMGSIDLYENATVLISEESYILQCKLYQAVKTAKTKINPFEFLVEALICELHKKNPSYELLPNRLRAMANIMFNNHHLLETFINIDKEKRIITISEENYNLKPYIHLIKSNAHSDGDLIGVVQDSEGKLFCLAGDVLISEKELDNKHFLSSVTKDMDGIFPGHGNKINLNKRECRNC